MLAEKVRWEDRVRELGGRNFEESDDQMPDESVDDIMKDKNGYQYFGAAKNLPEVKQLMKHEAPHAPKTGLKELQSRVTAFYLGLEDPSSSDPDAIKLDQLEALEQEAELKMRKLDAGKDFKDNFLQKKRRRIELL